MSVAALPVKVDSKVRQHTTHTEQEDTLSHSSLQEWWSVSSKGRDTFGVGRRRLYIWVEGSVLRLMIDGRAKC
jgi:hypothetical protein